MRNIRFRAWDLIDKTINNIKLIDCSNGQIELYGLPIPKKRIFCEVELMQFTGLCDRHGNPIFEGDIIKRSFQTEKDVGHVVFECGVFKMKWKKSFFSDTLYYHGPDGLIIGNIYENPELLDES